MTIKDQSFIPNVLGYTAEKNSTLGQIARFVETQAADCPLERIALAFFSLQRERQNAIRSEMETGVPASGPLFKPERLLSFVQSMMNGVCWAARRLYVANDRQDANDLGNGIDFSEQVSDWVGVRASNDHIPELVDSDYLALNRLHSLLAVKMGYLTDIAPLYHFEERVRDDQGNWYVAKTCGSFAEALPVMDEIVVRLQQQSEASEVADFMKQLRAA
jgi:hypothetical protein